MVGAGWAGWSDVGTWKTRIYESSTWPAGNISRFNKGCFLLEFSRQFAKQEGVLVFLLD